MKKLFLGFAVVAVVIGGLLAVLPFIVQVDRYRHWLVEQANAYLQGKLELGRLDLSLWGRVRIRVAGVRLLDGQGKEVVEVKDAFLDFPIQSLLMGEPKLVIALESPELSISRDPEGKLNLAALIKSEAQAEPTPPPKASPGKAELAIPALALKSRVQVELRHARLSYADAVSGLKTQIPDLGIYLQDVSLTRPIQYKISGDINLSQGKALTLRGPVALEGTARVAFTEGVLKSAEIESLLQLSGLELSASDAFAKPKGVPLEARWKLIATPATVQVEKFVFKIANAEISVKGQLDAPPVSRLALEVRSNSIDIKPWAEWVKGLGEFQLSGRAKLDADVSGPLASFGYKGVLALSDVRVAAPMLKAPPVIQARVEVAPDKIEKLSVDVAGPGSDLRLSGSIVGFAKPKVRMLLSSKGLDLDQWLALPPPAKADKSAKATVPAPAPDNGAAKSDGKQADRDRILAPLRNPLVRGMDAELEVRIPRFRAYAVDVTDWVGKLYAKGGEIGWQDLSFKVWEGKIQSRVALQTQPAVPTYRFGVKIDGLNLKQAMESQLQLFKNTLHGKLAMSADGTGTSLNTPVALKSLGLKGGIKATQARFVTIDVAKMVQSSLNNSIEKVAQSVPPLKGKQLQSLPQATAFYEFISCDFTVAEGRLNAPNFYAKSLPNTGVDIKGSTELGLIDDSLSAHWELIDTHNMTKAYDLSPETNGVAVPHILSEGGAPVKVPVSAGCTLSAPCYSATQVAEYFTRVATKNIESALTARAKEELKRQGKQQLQKIIPQSAPPALKNLLNGF